MAAAGGRTLEETPTWAVAVVCFILVAISVVIEFIIHLIEKWLMKRNKKALCEALEKIKSELMLLGFISLLLTVGRGPISRTCVSKSIGNSWHPCDKAKESTKYEDDSDEHRRRRLLAFLDSGEIQRRVLAAAGSDKCAEKGKVPLISTDGIHQLHIFIFVLAVSHVLYCITTCVLGTAKMRKWETWEMETRTSEYQFANDPERFRFARDTTFGRRHLSFWSRSRFLLWPVCFFRQFVRSVTKVDYLTLRYGFIIAHLAPQNQISFDFQKYIKRSLEEDFKVVVGISPPIWLFAVFFLLFNTHGWRSYLWLPFIPLIIILLVGTKLQVIITKMGLRIQDRGEVVKGTPLVQPDDDLFWFSHPRLLLYLIHFVLFQNAFQLAFFVWSWYEFGFRSCFHEKKEDVIISITMGDTGEIWHHTAKKQIKQQRHLTNMPPLQSQPGTSLNGTSPDHLLLYYKKELDSVNTSPGISDYTTGEGEAEGSEEHSPQHEASSRSHQSRNDNIMQEGTGFSEQINNQPQPQPIPQTRLFQHEVDIESSAEFSFSKN